MPKTNKVLHYSGQFDPAQIIQGANQAKKYLHDMLPEGALLTNLEKKLDKIVRNATTASAKMQQGFTSKSGVSEFSRLIASIDTQVAELGIEINNLPLDKFKLPANVASQYKELTNVVNKAKENIGQLKSQLGNILSGNRASFNLDFLDEKDLANLTAAIGDAGELKRIIDDISKKKIDPLAENAGEDLLNLEVQLERLNKSLKKDLEANATAYAREVMGGKSRGILKGQDIELYDFARNEYLNNPQNLENLQKASARYQQLTTAIINAKNASDEFSRRQQALQNISDLLSGKKVGSNQLGQSISELIVSLSFATSAYEDAEKAQKNFLETEGVQAARASHEQLSNSISSLNNNSQTASEGISKLNQEFDQFNQQAKALDQFKQRMQYLLSFTNVFYTLRRVITSAKNSILELDAAFNDIAVVTNMTNEQLWASFDTYNQMAQRLGVTTTDAIKTSALYYQQGLETVEVMELTEETIKLASIAGMDFSEATDRMTAALRGFKLEMEDANRVNDIFSALAAKSAVDTDELSLALTKTASIAASAGMELETTSALLSLMIESTREAPENLGTAMKTVVARFQELKKAVGEVEVEGEIVDVNKVETALRSVGVSLRDELTGQFRDLDDVFLELSSIWNTLDRNTQRYVATIAAGSRLRFNRLLLAA